MNSRRIQRSVWRGGIVSIVLLIAACGKKTPPPESTPAGQPAQVPTDPAAPRASDGATATNPLPVAAVEAIEPADRPRPRVLLWVEGSPEENTIWRGWPVLVRVQTLAGEPPTDVQMPEPSSVAMTRAGAVWLISSGDSAQLALGNYTLSAGEQKVAVAVADAPRELSTGQESMRSRLLVLSAIASGDLAAAKQAADAWVQAAPDAFEAREAQGDVLRLHGDKAGALDAYNAAVQRVPRGIDPPPAGLHGKITALLRERAAALPSKPSTEPTTDELKYYEFIDAGDEALAAGDRAAASQRYADADAFRVARSLAVSSLELDDKRAALTSTTAESAPASAIAATSAQPAPATTTPTGSLPSPPGAPGTSTVAANAGAAPGLLIPATELSDAIILADADGQWAASATASSEYGAPRYGAVQATGVPNIPLGLAGDNPDAWCPAEKNEGTAWLELTFANPVHATEVRVRQNNAPGAIAKVEVITPDGTAHVWWEGVDPFVAPAVREIAWFAVRAPRTDDVVTRVRLTFNLATVPGWKQVDAVQLVSGAL